LLAEVGTQKIERIFTSPMDSRSLFTGPLTAEDVGGSVTSPVSRGVTVTRNPTKGRLSPIKIPAPRIGGDVESDGLNVDSVISSLTLADGGWAMQADRRAKGEKEPEYVHDQEAAHEAHEDRDSDERHTGQGPSEESLKNPSLVSRETMDGKSVNKEGADVKMRTSLHRPTRSRCQLPNIPRWRSRMLCRTRWNLNPNFQLQGRRSPMPSLCYHKMQRPCNLMFLPPHQTPVRRDSCLLLQKNGTRST
jgi:hypothetical protein